MTTITIPQGESLDPFLRSHRRDARFVLGPGNHSTDGAFAFADLDFSMLGPGCELIGAGSHRTHIIASDSKVPPGAGQLECLTAGSRTGYCGFVRIEGVSVYPVATPLTRQFLGIVGVHAWSDRCVIRDVVASEITGTRQKPGEASREGFGLLVNQCGMPARPGGSRISGIRVELPTLFEPGAKAEQYVCGCYVGYASPSEPSFVSDVEAWNPSASPAHAAFGVNGGVIGVGWRNVGRWNRAVFCDVTGGVGTTIDASHFHAERVAVEFRGGTRLQWRDVVVRGSQITLRPPREADYAAVLVLADDTPNKVDVEFNSIVVDGCLVRLVHSRAVASGEKAQDFYFGSVDAALSSQCGVFGTRTSGRLLAPQITKASPTSAFTVS